MNVSVDEAGQQESRSVVVGFSTFEIARE
jgi:hypothetical protein